MINPASESIRIKNLRKTRNDKVFIETASKADLEKITGNPKIKERDLCTEVSTAKKPRIIVYDIPRHLQEDSIKRAIFAQNSEIFEDVSYDSFSENVNFKFKTGKRDGDTVHWVIKCSAMLRNRMRNAARIFIEWSRCRVLDYLSLSRCYKCLDLDIARYCKAKMETYARCGLDGHNRLNCPTKDAAASCGLCRRKGRPCNHAVDDSNFPLYCLSRERYVQSIDYRA